jgi:hypothetical protein
VKLSGSRIEDIRGGRRQLRNCELHNLHSSPDITRVIKSRKIGWAGQVDHVEKRHACRVSVGKPERKEPTSKT